VTKISAEGICKSFAGPRQRVEAVSSFSLTVDDGEFVCLVGPSGCGKSTFLRIVAGLTEPPRDVLKYVETQTVSSR